jgi:hypothetical protein
MPKWLNPMNYWLLDSGTSAHMTPYRTDIDMNSFRPVTNGYVKVANNQHEPIIGIGNVTILIKCYRTGMNITWTLFNVVVVPTIVRRLIATDELNDAGHSIGMEPLGIVLPLREHPNVPTQRKVTVLKYPRTWEYDSGAKEYQWPAVKYQFAIGTAPQGFLILPVSLSLSQETVASANAVEDKTDDAPPNDDNAGSDDDSTSDEGSEIGKENSSAEETQATKRAVHLQTIHNRLGHRSVKSLLLGNRDNIWNDVKVQRDPESICQTCQITLARKLAQNKKATADFPSKPGCMVTIDIIQNPFSTGLTKKSYFGYYLLIVDVYSTMPVLFGLKSLTDIVLFGRLKCILRPSSRRSTNQGLPAKSMDITCNIFEPTPEPNLPAEFIQACHDEGINISLAAPKHQEMNGICERTWQSFRNLAFSSMNYTRVGEEFGGMAFENAWKVFSVIPIKGLCKKCNVTTPYELFYGIKPSIRKFRTMFFPCVYKVYMRTKTVSSKTVRHFDLKTHPQRGVIGIFCGFPRSQAGYLIWEPRSKKIVVSADSQFDKKFHSMGPRQHFAFKDALPVIVKSSQPNISKFQRTDTDDDHEGVPKTEYTKEFESNGFLSIMQNAAQHELLDNVAPQFEDEFTSDDEQSLEERPIMEEQPSMEENDDDDTKPSTGPSLSPPTPIRPDLSNTSDDDDAQYQDPTALAQQPLCRSHCSCKKRHIFDPSEESHAVHLSDFANLVTLAFDKDVTPELVMQHVYQAAAKFKSTGIKGADPSAFLPEPKSLKKIAQMETPIRKAWLNAY